MNIIRTKYEAAVLIDRTNAVYQLTPAILEPPGRIVWTGTPTEKWVEAEDCAVIALIEKFGPPSLSDIVRCLVGIIESGDRAGNVLAITNSEAFRQAREYVARLSLSETA